jgi:hypothetical protein
MTETQMHIPAHIEMTRRIAAQQASDVTRLTAAEQQLRAQLDEHQNDAAAEKARVEAEIREFVEKRQQHLDALAETGRRLSGQLTDVGRALQQHREEATEAQQTVADWCTRKGITLTDLPPIPDTGPLPAIPALATAPEPAKCPECLAPMPGQHYPQCPPAAEPKLPALPALEAPDALLNAGRRAADPNATQVDGGDGPTRPFQGGVESPAGPRPKRPRRRAQQTSDRVNDQDGDA